MYRLLTLCLLILAASARADEYPDWRAPLAPFQIADNLYYVGSRDLAAYLVTTPKGNILINANLATFAAAHPSKYREAWLPLV